MLYINVEDYCLNFLKESPSHLEEYLNIHPLSYKRLRVLAKYYRKHEQFEKAAKAYITLGQSE
jgi:cytochrome c-type biogenesis protein CcmH/NrfG